MRLALHAREVRARPNFRSGAMETNLIATGRFSSSSKAAYTLPAPPEPRSVPTRYRPIFMPVWGTNRSSGREREVSRRGREALASFEDRHRLPDDERIGLSRLQEGAPFPGRQLLGLEDQLPDRIPAAIAFTGKADLPTGLRLPSWHQYGVYTVLAGECGPLHR